MRSSLATILLLGLGLAGCAGPGPVGFPPATHEVDRSSYDVDGNGDPDFAILHDRAALQFGSERVPYPPDADAPHFVLILDSIPYELIAEAQRNGWLRLFPPASELISPFPVMTDVALADLYNVFPLPGVESQFLVDGQLNDATSAYLAEENMPWTRHMDYRMEPLGHAFAYSDPYPWLGHELGRIERRGLTALKDGRSYTAYVVGTSALGSHAGRTGHVHALRQVEQLCLRMLYELRGQVHITLLSDHGHDYDPGQWFSLRQAIEAAGFRTGSRLRDADAVVPEWGLVSCAAVFTPMPAELTRHIVLLEGVEHCLHREGSRVVVSAPSGTAAISQQGDQLRYERISGDPLQVLGNDEVERTHTRDAWLRETGSGPWPHAVTRCWDAMDGYFAVAPDVLVSLAPGYYVGSPDLHKRLAMQATHGSLRRAGSVGFACSTTGQLPAVLAMDELPTAIEALPLGHWVTE